MLDEPFAILGLPVTATTREIEREAAKLLGMLELGIGDVATYCGAAGPTPRTPEAVRAAAACLRDPRRRLGAELLAGAIAVDDPTPPAAAPPIMTWPAALRDLGWGPR